MTTAYMAKLKLIHPGEILMEEFLKPLNVSQYRLAAAQTELKQVAAFVDVLGSYPVAV